MHETKKTNSSTCKVYHPPKNKPASEVFYSIGLALCDDDDDDDKSNNLYRYFFAFAHTINTEQRTKNN